MRFLICGVLSFVTFVVIAQQINDVQSFHFYLVKHKWFGLALVLSSFFFTKKHATSYTLMIAGMAFWGVAHSAPKFPNGFKLRGARATLVSKDFLVFGQQTVILKSNDSLLRVYAFQNVQIGQQGRVICSAKNGDCSFRVTKKRNSISPPKMLIYSNKMKSIIHQRVKAFSPILRRWTLLLLFGDLSTLDQERKETYKHLGLFHMLVISGAHISFLSEALKLLFILITALPYALRMLRPDYYCIFHLMWRCLLLVVVFSFSFLVGFSAAVQRAALVFLCREFLWILFGIKDLKRWISLACFAQIIIFPVSFLSQGNLMSWSAFLTLQFSFGQLGEASQFGKLYARILIQSILALFGFIFFGYWSFFSIPLNLLLSGYFTMICFLLLFNLITNGKFEWLIYLCELFIVNLEQFVSLLKERFLLGFHAQESFLEVLITFSLIMILIVLLKASLYIFAPKGVRINS